jgi:hypothetical protein
MSLAAALLLATDPQLAAAQQAPASIAVSQPGSPAAAAPPQGEPPAAIADLAQMDVVVVRGERIPGSVPGNVQPVQVISGFEVRTLGAGSVQEVLASLAPQLASVRGGTGRPLILVNARRVTDFSEVRDIPPEAIRRIEIFPEEVGLRYGATGGQRVVNIILNPRYRSGLVQGTLGVAADGESDRQTLAFGNTAIGETSRTSLALELDDRDGVSEADLGVTNGSLRSLLPDSTSLRLSGSHGRMLPALGELGWGSLGLDIQTGEDESNLGRAADGFIRERRVTTDSIRLSGAVEGDRGGWQLNGRALGSFQTRESRSLLDSAAGNVARSETSSSDLTAEITAIRSLFELPSGPVLLTVDGSVASRDLEGRSDRFSVTTDSGGNRGEARLAGQLSLPVASRRRDSAIGNLTLTLGGGLTAVDGYDNLPEATVGLSWGPIPDLQVSLLGSSRAEAPTMANLFAPQDTAFGTLVYDGATGQSVRADVLSGGRSDLNETTTNEASLSVSWSPERVEGLIVNGAYRWSRSDDAVGSITLATQRTEAALPGLYQRDVSGALTSLDTRPINFDQREREIARWGFTYTRNFGDPPRFIQMLQQRVQAADDANPDSAPGPDGLPPGIAPPPGMRPPPGSEGGPPPELINMLRSGARLPGARWNIGVTHEVRLADEIILPGGSTLDLLDGDAIGIGDGSVHTVDLEGGVTWQGIGLRGTGRWTSGYDVRTGAETLSWDDQFTLNLRAFFLADLRPELTFAFPILRGSRFQLEVNNVTDSTREVTSSSGQQSAALSGAQADPEGRTFALSWRKRF